VRYAKVLSVSNFEFSVRAVLLFALLSTGCDHHYRASFDMTWECTPELNKPEYPNAQTVRLRFVQDPAYFEEIAGRGLCDELKASNQSVVNVEYDMWGNSFNGLHGFNEVSIDGRPIVDAGGYWGKSGANDPKGPSPISVAFEQMRR
jgi:hypothetical protein